MWWNVFVRVLCASTLDTNAAVCLHIFALLSRLLLDRMSCDNVGSATTLNLIDMWTTRWRIVCRSQAARECSCSRILLNTIYITSCDLLQAILLYLNQFLAIYVALKSIVYYFCNLSFDSRGASTVNEIKAYTRCRCCDAARRDARATCTCRAARPRSWSVLLSADGPCRHTYKFNEKIK